MSSSMKALHGAIDFYNSNVPVKALDSRIYVVILYSVDVRIYVVSVKTFRSKSSSPSS